MLLESINIITVTKQNAFPLLQFLQSLSQEKQKMQTTQMSLLINTPD